jgi:hypothetical protein
VRGLAPSLVLGFEPRAGRHSGGPNSKGAWGGEPWKSPDPDPELRINEARLDEAGPFVEIYNAGSSPQKLDGLKLTRHPLGEGGVSLSGTVAKRRHHVLNGEAVRPLCAGGGRLYLVRANTLELLDSLPVRKAVPKDGSFGRCPDGEGDTFTLAKATPGATNGKTPRSDLVINEILYRGRKEAPRAKDSADAADDAEFIEIHNRSRAAISLKGWKLERAVRFSFPDDAEIPAGGYVAVGANPEKLRARVPPEDAKHVFGPFKGKLSNAGDSIVLSDPAGDSLDRVPYLDRAPWPVGADGEGFSMELLHPDLDNRLGAAWTLGPQGGTPARKNARSVTNMSPVIASVLHSPAAPSSDEEIVIRADVVDNSSISEVVVVYRDLSGNSKPAKKALSDAGKEDDGDAKDGHYAVRLPRMRAGTLLGFYIQAKDSSGKTTRFPEGDGELCLQVEPPSKNDSGPRIPTYHVLMPPQQWERFERTNHFQDTKFPCTLVVTFDNRGPSSRGGLVFYDAKIRYRGNNSRRPPDGRMSYRIELARGDQFDGRDRIILNAYSSLIQKAAGDVFRLLGVATPDVSVVRLKTPGIDDVHYVDVEVLNNEFLKRRFGGPPGPIFRGRLQRGRVAADLSYHGNDPSSYLGAYEPMNRRGTTAGAALVQVLEALATKDEKLYAQRIAQLIDVEEWAAYFAVNHVLMNDENGLSKGVADDFFIAQRPTDGKFILLAWDHDSLFTRMRYEPIYGPGVPAVRRLLVHPRVAPLYHGAIRRILDGPLAGDGALPRFAALRELFPFPGGGEHREFRRQPAVPAARALRPLAAGVCGRQRRGWGALRLRHEDFLGRAGRAGGAPDGHRRPGRDFPGQSARQHRHVRRRQRTLEHLSARRVVLGRAQCLLGRAPRAARRSARKLRDRRGEGKDCAARAPGDPRGGRVEARSRSVRA